MWAQASSFGHRSRVWQTDRQTDRQKGPDNTVHCITCSRTLQTDATNCVC